MFDLTSDFRTKKIMNKDEFGGSLPQNQQRSSCLTMEMEMEMEMGVCCSAAIHMREWGLGSLRSERLRQRERE